MTTRGSSLVESLVALSVLSIGSVATGAWVIHSTLGDVRVSRLLAVDAIASSLEARMRSNPTGFDQGAYLNQAPPATCVRSCGAADLAADDMWRFREALARHLGAGAEGGVHCASSNTCVIHITWSGTEVLAWPLER
jgi:type II secretory pathway pseudopilin PulG